MNNNDNGNDDNAIPDANSIDVVFDGPPSHETGRFVEVEDMSGNSINAGEWIDRQNGLWALRIRPRQATPRAQEPFFTIGEAKALMRNFADRLMVEGIISTLMSGYHPLDDDDDNVRREAEDFLLAFAKVHDYLNTIGAKACNCGKTDLYDNLYKQFSNRRVAASLGNPNFEYDLSALKEVQSDPDIRQE